MPGWQPCTLHARHSQPIYLFSLTLSLLSFSYFTQSAVFGGGGAPLPPSTLTSSRPSRQGTLTSTSTAASIPTRVRWSGRASINESESLRGGGPPAHPLRRDLGPAQPPRAFRKANKLCDATIHLQNGASFRAHQAVLTAKSIKLEDLLVDAAAKEAGAAGLHLLASEVVLDTPRDTARIEPMEDEDDKEKEKDEEDEDDDETKQTKRTETPKPRRPPQRKRVTAAVTGAQNLYLRSLPSRIGKAFLDYLYTGTCELDEADLPLASERPSA